MSDDLKNLLNDSKVIQEKLRSFFDKCTEVIENLDRSVLTVEERSQLFHLHRLQYKIWELYIDLKKLNKPVLVEGILMKKSNGRYEVDGLELTSGQYLEYLREDQYGGHYVPSSIEHDGQDYYIVDLGKDTPIEGIRVRIK